MPARRLRIDWPACRANGVCAQLVPAIIALDEWGYPRITDGPIPPDQLPLAKHAVTGCPMSALRLVDVPQVPGSRRERRHGAG